MDIKGVLGTVVLFVAGMVSLSCGGGSSSSSGGVSSAALTIIPSSATVQTGNTQQFTTNMAANFSVSGTGCTGSACGTISSTGLYTAPAAAPNPNTVKVTATSVADVSKSATATVTITTASGTAPTCSISAVPSTISAGSSSTLSWKSTNATSASLDQGIGSVATSGSRSITPASTTTYTLTVTNTSGSGNCNATVTVNQNQSWTIGNGSFTSLVFTSKIPTADRTYITNLYNQIYPVFVSQFGPPPDVAPLTFDLCSWSYGANTHTMCMSALPTLPGTDQNSWNAVFLHELGGAMWLSQHTGVGSNWISEALGDIGAVLGQRVTGLVGQAFFGNELDYDVLRLGGKEIVGGVPGKAWTNTNTLGAGLNEEAAKEIFQILVATQSTAAISDWPNYSALKNVKSALYARANSCQCSLQDSDVFAALSSLGQPIEGVLPDQWVPAQPNAYTLGTPGTYLYAYPAPAANPSYLEVVAFVRLNKTIAPGVLEEDVCTSGTVTATVSSASGTVQTLTLNLSSANHELLFDTTPFALGSYRVQTSGTCNGTSVVSPDSYFGVFDRSLVPFPQSIGTLGSAMFLIGKDPASGKPSAKSIPTPTGGAPGQFLENSNGAAVWQVNGTSIPQPEYTLLGRRLYVPLPFSPVYVVDNP